MKTNEIKILGVNSDKDSCDCCGKNNLKRVVWLDMDGDVVAFGTSCAARALKVEGNWSASNAEKLVATVNARRETASKFAAACESAKAQAVKFGQEVGVFLSRGTRNTFFAFRMDGANAGLQGFPRATFKP